MSLILEALRKMEQERRIKRAAGDLRPEVLRYRGEAASSGKKPYLLVALGVLLLAVGIGTGFFLKGRNEAMVIERTEKDASGPTKSAATAAPPATVVVAPTAPAPPTASAPIASGLPAAPAGAKSMASSPIAASASPVAAPTPRVAVSRPAQELATAGDDEVPAVEAPASKRARRAATAPATASAPQGKNRKAKHPMQATADDVQATIPDITISGIAWQEERNLRRAVLNGTLVGEGAMVAGARVVEIKENRVRLSRGGQLFDVVFSSGLSSR